MSHAIPLIHPWLVAVWPGMGNVGVAAGYYLMAKLKAQQLAEYSTPELYDVDHVEVKSGLILPTRLPRSRMFLWKDPAQKRDLVIFLGEAQPPMGKFRFCTGLVDHARQLGVERVFTFAAMATDSQPNHESRVFAAATDHPTLDEVGEHELELLESGHIGGLNGVLLGAAAAAGLPAVCLLGEMPHALAQLPYPAASLAVLRKFTQWAGIDLDLTELADEAEVVGQQLHELWNRAKRALQAATEGHAEEEEEFQPEPAEEERLTKADRQRIEDLFRAAALDRSRAYELKRELDRLDAFAEYEDRFLDLFRKSSEESGER